MENLSKLIVSAENFEEALSQGGISSVQNADGSATGSSPASGVLLQRNVSVPFLLRQLGGAKGFWSTPTGGTLEQGRANRTNRSL